MFSVTQDTFGDQSVAYVSVYRFLEMIYDGLKR